MGNNLENPLPAILIADACQVLTRQASLTKTYVNGEQHLTGLVQLLLPPVSLVICGAGNDTMPLVQMASVLGWRITVIDGRANYATPERFPQADQVLVSKPGKVLAQLTPDEQTVFVLMTHNYNYDLAMLRQLIPLHIPYIGSLGPKKKLDRMLAELQDEGIYLTEEQRQKIYGPTGLDLGAETAEEIALSILSEIKAVLSQKDGTPLRNKPDSIHARPSETITQVSLSD